MKTETLPTYERCLEADEAGCADNLMSFIRINTPADGEEYGEGMFRDDLAAAITDVEEALSGKILSRLAVIFTDYKNAGFENSAQVTKFIMNEIETIVKG